MNWQNIVPATEAVIDGYKTIQLLASIEKTRGYILFPAFSLAVPNYSWPFIGAQYNGITNEAFILDEIPLTRISNDWMICISWRSDDYWKVRYQLWEDPTYGFRVYARDIIHRYFTLEFWCKDTTAIVLPTNLTLRTSQRVNNDGLDTSHSVSTVNALVTTELWWSLPFVIPFTPNSLGPWLKNIGTWNEVMASSELRASEMLPAGHS